MAETKAKATVNEVAEKGTAANKEDKTAAPVKKAPAKKAPAKKTPAKKTVAKKAPAKKAEVKASVNLQFDGKSYTNDDLIKIAKDVWKYDLGRKPAELKTVELYVKPEEARAYYIMNGENSGSFAI